MTSDPPVGSGCLFPGVAIEPHTCYHFSKLCPKEDETISSTIFVGNLPFETTEEDLRAVLAEADPSVRVRLGMDRATGKPRGFAFAEFTDAARAADAIRRFDAYELKGRKLRVNDADDKPPARAPRPMNAGAPPMQSFNGGGFDPGFGGGGGGFEQEGGFRRKGGSRRGLRGKKRSLR